MKLKPGLVRTGAIDLEETRRQAEDAGYATFVLPANIIDRASLFDAIRATLPLDPPLLGTRSWDAMSDSLWEGLYTHAAQRLVILWPHARGMEDSASSDFETALNVLADVASLLADPQATRDNPKEVTFLVE